MRVSSRVLAALLSLGAVCSVHAGGGAKSAKDLPESVGRPARPASGALSTGSIAAVALESPLVLRPVGYLATIGPAPLRFGPPSPGCNERTPPRVASTSKKAPVATSGIEVQPTQQQSPFPTPPPTEFLDSSLAPANPADELVNMLRPDDSDPEVQKRRMRFMLEQPSFRPAVPPTPNAQPPQSRATFRQN